MTQQLQQHRQTFSCVEIVFYRQNANGAHYTILSRGLRCFRALYRKQREDNHEFRAHSQAVAVCFDAAAVQFDQATNDGEPNT